jgi:hypothetical protein
MCSSLGLLDFRVSASLIIQNECRFILWLFAVMIFIFMCVGFVPLKLKNICVMVVNIWHDIVITYSGRMLWDVSEEREPLQSGRLRSRVADVKSQREIYLITVVWCREESKKKKKVGTFGFRGMKTCDGNFRGAECCARSVYVASSPFLHQRRTCSACDLYGWVLNDLHWRDLSRQILRSRLRPHHFVIIVLMILPSEAI